MRLLITLLCLVGTIYGTQAQSSIQSSKGTLSQSNSLDDYFTDYKIVEIDAAATMAQLQSRNFKYQMAIDLGDDDRWMLDLHPENVLSPNFKLNNGGRMEDFNGSVFNYSATDKNHPGKEARLTITADYIGGYLPAGDTKLFLEPLRRFVSGAATNQYIVYLETAVVNRAVSCGANDSSTQPGAPNTPPATARAGECFIVDLSVAVDRALFNDYSSNTAVVAHVNSNMNMVNGNFTGPFTNDIEFQVNEIFIPANAGQDPVPASTTNASDVLTAFRGWAGNGFGMVHDLGQFLTSRDFDGTTVGIASSGITDSNGNAVGVGVVCTFARYHAVQDFMNNADALRAITAHEIGHNWSASHTSSGIMTASINFGSPANFWDGTSMTEISEGIQFTADNQGCLASCCITNQPPTANFSLSKNLICAGNSIDYNDLSENCPTSVSWTFSGGSPATSMLPNPSVLYNTQGTFTTALVANNAAGPGTTASTDITVLAPGATACTINGTPGDAGIGRFALNGRTIITGTSSEDAANNDLPQLGTKVVDLACVELIEVVPGATYEAQISIALGFSTQNVRVYLDLNQNATFESSERLISVTYTVPGGTGFATAAPDITIPNGLLPNQIYRLRVIADTQGGNGCTVSGPGQAEDYGVVFLNGALPVSLQSFDGKKIDKAVELNWSTASETNNDYFSLERSADGRNFETITEVSGAGTATTVQNYGFIDRQPLSGDNYYRLKQIDFDGAYEYVGDIVLVNMPAGNDVKIFPNPIAGGRVQIGISTGTDQATILEIYGVNGQLMRARQIDLYAGTQSVEIDVADLPRGVYLLKTQIDGKVTTTRFVKGE